MSVTITLGNISLGDGSNYAVVTNPGAWRQPGGWLEMEVIVHGGSQDQVDARRRALISEINRAEVAWRDGRASERVTLDVAWHTSATVSFVVREGLVSPLRYYPGQRHARVILRLRCEAVAGRAVAYLADDERDQSDTLTHALDSVVLIEDIGGDYPAGVRVTFTDESTTGAINLLRLSAISGVDLSLGDWDPFINIANSGSSDQSDSGAFGNSYERLSLTSATNWTYLGTAAMPAGTLNRGTFNPRARVRAIASALAAPGSLAAVESTIFPRVRQAENAANAAAGTSIEATWTGATLAGSTLVAVVKASKTMTKLNITAAADDGVNAGETTVTTESAHGLANGDRVLIEGVEGVEGHQPSINGVWEVSRVTSTTFNITTNTVNNDNSTFGTVREIFFEDIDSVEAGYVLLDSQVSPEQVNEATTSGGSFGRPLLTDHDTVKQTRYWLYAAPAAAAESDAVTFGFDASLTNRAIALLEVANPGANGGLGLLVTEPDEAILFPPAGPANTLYIGIAATETASWQPMFGFAQQEDAGGLIVATKHVGEAQSQPWRAVPSNYAVPALSALLAIEGAALPAGYDLQPGQYGIRVQGVTFAGDAGTPTTTVNVTVTRTNSAISASWTAPSGATGISHYRITVQDPDGVIRQQDTPTNATSYVIESVADWEPVSALPTAGVASPPEIQLRIRHGDAALDNARGAGDGLTVRTVRGLSGFHDVDFGVVAFPPQGEMADGGWPDWAADFYGRNGGGAAHNLDIDMLTLDSIESGLTLWYPGKNLSTKRVWVAEVRADGSVVAWLEDGSGNYVGSVHAVGDLLLGPGDALVKISAEQASGLSVLDACQFKAQITLYPVADWFV